MMVVRQTAQTSNPLFADHHRQWTMTTACEAFEDTLNDYRATRETR